MRQLHLLNKFLSILVIALALYVMCLPLAPEVAYAYRSARFGLSAQIHNPQFGKNSLVVSSIFVNGEIFEGYDEKTLKQGLWRIPHSSTPDKGGNTVIVAHRYLFTSGPNTFYHLDKVKVGDTFQIFWQGRQYSYQVYSVEIVGPERVDIEDDTAEPIVTLYTCTPLWTSLNRLVVRGRPI